MSDEHQCKGGHGPHPDITCREISEFLLAYLEHELDDGARAEFDRHLQVCPPCVHYLDGYRETVELVRACGRRELDPAQRRAQRPPEDLIQAILQAKSQSK